MSGITPTTTKILNGPLDPKHVSQRNQSGRSLSYIEGWHAIAEANRVFGFDGWDRTLTTCECVNQKERKIGAAKNDGWGVTYIARVRILVRFGSTETTREGCGAGHGIDRDLGQAHESAIKEAETDAMKRALMTFGNKFGLALYDKTQANVRAEDGRLPNAKAKPIADKINKLINESVTVEQLDLNWTEIVDEYMSLIPKGWEQPLMDKYANKRDELKDKMS
ncbi:MAG: RAD52 family DNA repair protein [Flavobacteriales bacterium]|nr:RAD52 family DNA repair protein [Flavobacteriales bacterium]